MEIKLRVHHGGAFVRVPELVYFEGEVKDIIVDPDELSLHEINVMPPILNYLLRLI